jgi:hypothetical protein
LRSSSQGFLRKGRVREFARTVGDNEVVGLFLCLWTGRC